MKIDWSKKLSSRKFWVAIASVIISTLTLLNVNAETITKVGALLSNAIVLCMYIFIEGDSSRELRLQDTPVMTVNTTGDREHDNFSGFDGTIPQ